MPDLHVPEGIREIPRGEWKALIGDDSPFLEWDCSLIPELLTERVPARGPKTGLARRGGEAA